MATKEVRWRTLLVPLAFGAIAACGAGGSGSGAVPAIIGGGGTGGGGGSGGGSGGSGGGSGGGGSFASTSTIIEDEADAVRFLSYATFGGSQTQIDALVGQDAADWLEVEFNRAPTLTLSRVLGAADADGRIPSGTVDGQYWDQLLTSNDQLRQRMAFALSQIFVYSDRADGDQAQRAYFQDVLIRNAFGNYRDLLEEVTYSPAMGRFLTYHRNRKGDPSIGRMPDENYAREILQLFSIGLVELNMDGTPKAGEPETYDNEDVVGLAKVFTGLATNGKSFRNNYDDADYNPMVMFDDEHSPLEKSFLGITIPPNSRGDESIQIALDTIFEHPNVAPFISRQLIQRFTASDPNPAYVERVATAFENGTYTGTNGQTFGTGQRGDLEATLAAILLEGAVFDVPDDTGVENLNGKIREPILRFSQMVRAFEYDDIDSSNERNLRDTSGFADGLGQHPFRSPSVFNFYRPGFVAPNTRSGELGLTAPEFQILNSSTAIGYNSFMSDFAFDRSTTRNPDVNTFRPNYATELALTDTPAALVDHLAMLLTADRMPPEEREEITTILEQLPINTNDTDRETADRLQIVGTAVLLVTNSASYAITW